MSLLGNEPLGLMQQGIQQGNSLWLHARCYVSDSMAQEDIAGKQKYVFTHCHGKKHETLNQYLIDYHII